MPAKYPIIATGQTSKNWNGDSIWFLVSDDSATTDAGSADDVTFKATSFPDAGQTLVVNSNTTCKSINWTSALNSPVFKVSANLYVNGAATFIAAMSMAGSDTSKQLYFQNVDATLTTNGLDLVVRVTMNGQTKTLTLADALTCNRILHYGGTINTANKTVTCLGNTISDGGDTSAKTWTLGSSTINTVGWNFAGTAANLTLTANTSTINVAAGLTGLFAGGTPTGSYNNINLNGTTHIISGTFTCATLTRNGTAAGGDSVTFTSSTTVTVTTCAMKGSSTDYPLKVLATTAGTQATITATNWTGSQYIGLKDILATNAVNLSAITGKAVNFGNCTNITFTTNMTQRNLAKALGII